MRWLILEYIKSVNNIVRFKIKDQSHICRSFTNFTNFGESFECYSNGVFLKSQGSIAWRSDEKTLFTRGDLFARDNNTADCSQFDWILIKEAVQEYNYYFEHKVPCIIGELFDPIIPKELFTL